MIYRLIGYFCSSFTYMVVAMIAASTLHNAVKQYASSMPTKQCFRYERSLRCQNLTFENELTLKYSFSGDCHQSYVQILVSRIIEQYDWMLGEPIDEMDCILLVKTYREDKDLSLNQTELLALLELQRDHNFVKQVHELVLGELAIEPGKLREKVNDLF